MEEWDDVESRLILDTWSIRTTDRETSYELGVGHMRCMGVVGRECQYLVQIVILLTHDEDVDRVVLEGSSELK